MCVANTTTTHVELVGVWVIIFVLKVDFSLKNTALRQKQRKGSSTSLGFINLMLSGDIIFCAV